MTRGGRALQTGKMLRGKKHFKHQILTPIKVTGGRAESCFKGRLVALRCHIAFPRGYTLAGSRGMRGIFTLELLRIPKVSLCRVHSSSDKPL